MFHYRRSQIYMKITIGPMSPLLGLIDCQNFASLISTVPFLNIFWGEYFKAHPRHHISPLEWISAWEGISKDTIYVLLIHKQINNNSLMSSNTQVMFKVHQFPQKYIFIINLLDFGLKQGLYMQLIGIFPKCLKMTCLYWGKI